MVVFFRKSLFCFIIFSHPSQTIFAWSFLVAKDTIWLPLSTLSTASAIATPEASTDFPFFLAIKKKAVLNLRIHFVLPFCMIGLPFSSRAFFCQPKSITRAFFCHSSSSIFCPASSPSKCRNCSITATYARPIFLTKRISSLLPDSTSARSFLCRSKVFS